MGYLSEVTLGLIDKILPAKPGKNIHDQYLNMMKIAITLAEGEMDDWHNYVSKHQIKITPEIVIKKHQETFRYHLENQIKLFQQR